MPWSKRLKEFSVKNKNLLSIWAGSALLLSVFIKIMDSIFQTGEIHRLDLLAFSLVEKIRSPLMTTLEKTFTSLGSTKTIIFLTLTVIVILWISKQRWIALYMLLVTIGARLGTLLIKFEIARDRPQIIPHLVKARGFSFPSGHSFVSASVYLALYLIACGFVKNQKPRIFIFCFAFLLIILISSSRVYLGVHYLSDIMAGVSIGTAWTLFLSPIFLRKRNDLRVDRS